MGHMDPIAYTYEADYHCPACTEQRFGRSARGFIAEESHDNEGNPVGAVFPWDEWCESSELGRQVLSCGTCHGEIDSCEHGDEDEDEDEDDHRYNPAPFCAKCSGPCRMNAV